MSIGDGVFRARSALSDRRKRALHRLRHSPHGSLPPRGDVFNLDLHIAVIADVRVALESRGISLTSWSLSGHGWVFDRERDPVAVVNERTWLGLSPELVEAFQRAYGTYLREFRGFIATYPPGFALLYEGFPRPTLAVCATRYEWPFTHDAARWRWLDASLREGVAAQSLYLVANNRADADYLTNYTGVRPAHIPSGCAYIAPGYSGRKPAAVVSSKRDVLARSICDALEYEAVPLRRELGKRFKWAELYEYRALVVMPYNVSIMSISEHYSACAPIYVPDRAFLKQLMAQHPDEILSDLSFSQVTGRPAADRPDAELDLNDPRDEQMVDWFLDRADFYDPTWMPHVRTFESWSHLDHLLATDDQLAISQEMAADKRGRLARIAELWDEVEWLARVASPAS